MDLPQLISHLPEVYQPIYGHPDYDLDASRSCHDRLQTVLDVMHRLHTHLNRPLRVLDLGCAQGYFSLSMAAHGATVTGIDRVPQNIAVCNRLAEENGGLAVRFRCATVEEILEDLAPHAFDLVICLSVLHHLCYEKGAAEVRKLVSTLPPKIEAALFEAALRTEPVAWGPSQPEDYHWLFDDFPFVVTVAYHSTHLSNVSRPLVFASSRHWLLGHDMRSFDRWTSRSHDLVIGEDNGRRYFFADGILAKVMRFNEPHGIQNQLELDNEHAFLCNPPPAFPPLPRVVGWARTQTEGWLIRELLPGVPLSTAIAQSLSFRPETIVEDVLSELAMLEDAGLYHDDVRVWNILLQSDGRARLMDYGSIGRSKRDREWPHDIYLSFLILLHEIFALQLPRVRPTRYPLFVRNALPGPYGQWVINLWNLDPAERRFSVYRTTLLATTQTDELPKRTHSSTLLWMGALEEFVEANTAHLEHRLAAIETQLDAVRQRFDNQDRTLRFLAPLLRLLRKLFRRA